MLCATNSFIFILSQQFLVDSEEEIFYCHYLQGMAKNSFLRSLRYAQGFILLHLYNTTITIITCLHSAQKASTLSLFIYLSNYKCYSLVSVKMWPVSRFSDRKFCCLRLQQRLNSSILTHYALKLLRHLNFIANY